MDFAGTDRYELTFSSHDTRGQLLVDAIIENCQATATAPPAPGPEWVLPMGADMINIFSFLFVFYRQLDNFCNITFFSDQLSSYGK